MTQRSPINYPVTHSSTQQAWQHLSSQKSPPAFTIIFGPTASGKSSLAYQLAAHFNANILSFDSRHVYRKMDVVTGKDRPTETEKWQLFGLDLADPDQDFSVRHYYEYAKEVIEKQRQEQQALILVGGSWLYAKTLLQPPDTLFAPTNLKLRQQLEKFNTLELQIKVQADNPVAWQRFNNSDRHNPRRLIRAIETAQQINKKLVTQVKPLILPNEYQLFIINPSLEKITKNIADRIRARLMTGALAETERLMQDYPDWSKPAFQSTGYALIKEYLQQNLSLAELQAKWLIQEKNYAKRQQTWINKLLEQD